MTGPLASAALVARLRPAAGALGVGLAGYGAWLVLSGGRATDVLSVVTFVVLPIVVHDALLAPAVVAAGWLAARFVPAAARAPLAVALVVAGSIVLVAAPLVAVQVLGRRPADNPSVAPLDYATNLAALLALVLAATAGWVVVRAVRRRRASAPR
ncbi:hypothetical protein [Kineosporia sp. R_H_3]|uniref:hypothetical protein n=1 Tax=Kineosporia sp. R_H_3 TaxID=1961848 RepID=UPI000B4C0FB5|nr:hypothetical protein [Kineosporia sp. R_H_3]